MDTENVGPESPVIEVVRSDKLDDHYIEQRVKELAASVHVLDGLCVKCRHSFQNWSDPPESDPPRLSSEPGILDRAVETLELEAAAIAGCRYCALWLCTVNRCPEGLAIFRKLEARLQLLKSSYKASFGIVSWGTKHGVPFGQMLRLNFPGKTAFRGDVISANTAMVDSVPGFVSGDELRTFIPIISS